MYSLRFPNSSSSLLELDSDPMCHFGNYFSDPDRCLYPEIDYLIEASDAHVYSDWINNRKSGRFHRPLSLDLYVPNSRSSCFYCHLNQFIPTDHSTEKYSNYLLREIRLQGQLFKGDSKVEQIYFGGGSPAFLNDSQLNTLTQEIKRNFNLVEGGNFCVEIDAGQLIDCSMYALNEMGFNCAIVGVQDFDQQARHSKQCIQSEEANIQIICNIRRAGFKSVRVELSYGLPGQNLDKFACTLDKIIAANPNQVKFLNYQHLIERFKPIRNNIFTGLPATETRFEMTLLAISRLTEAGYSHIGMNLFARYDDPLAVAQRQGRLHYGLRGFSIYPDCDHVAFGVSGIGCIGPTLHQNHCDLLQYYDKLEQNILPILRGLELNADDLLRRSIMYALICHLVISYDSVEAFFPIDFKQYFVTELTDLQAYAEAGLVTLDNEEIAVTSKGQLFINDICRIFDKYLRKHH
ncbi:oxygen-independent coproporphyrinogen III oxidase [Nitrosomonas sp.]|uniref:oxygen-independent coproporphyrinogen III oxidase n=1 Tax=Nitrosomonas sp. TaxID=42353 RepID=UPI0025EE6202|nr:oxygen-independent coproporphyrinogen III oxidase [Nitrosomonas sp.]